MVVQNSRKSLKTQKCFTLESNIVISVGLFGHSGDDEVRSPGIKPRRTSTLNAISNLKPHFHCKHSNFWYEFLYSIAHIPEEPSLCHALKWRLVAVGNDVKSPFLYFFLTSPSCHPKSSSKSLAIF